MLQAHIRRVMGRRFFYDYYSIPVQVNLPFLRWMGHADMLYVGLHLWRKNLVSLRLFPPLNVSPARACNNMSPNAHTRQIDLNYPDPPSRYHLLR